MVAKQSIQSISGLQECKMNIKHEETLLIYDCELLFQAQDQQGQTYMVSHIAECHGECEYIAVPVNQKSLSQYKAGRIDLRQLMLAEGPEVWYSARATGNHGELTLKLQEALLSESAELPMKGFHHDHKFSRNAVP